MAHLRWFILMSLSLSASFAIAIEISQSIYEDMTGVQCRVANKIEWDTLQCKFKVGHMPKPVSDSAKEMDRVVEEITFKKLAENKIEELQCSSRMLDQINEDSKMADKFTQQTCLQLEPLLNSWEQSELLQKEIESYETITDRTLRPVPEEEFTRNSKVLAELKQLKSIYDANARAIIGMDTLLGSPQVLERVRSAAKGGLITKAKKHQEICEILSKELKSLLGAEREAIRKKTLSLQEFAKSPSGFFNIFIKKDLWTRGGRSALRSEFGQALDKSTMCRMEARYGKGLETAERLGMIASLGFGTAAALSGRAMAAAAVRGMGGAETIFAALTIAEFGVGTAISVAQTVQTCSNRFATAPTGKFCSAMTEKEIKNLLNSGAEAESCARSAVIGIFATALGGFGAKSALKGVADSKLLRTIEGQTAESQKIYKNTISRGQSLELDERTTQLARDIGIERSQIQKLTSGLSAEEQIRVTTALEKAQKQLGSEKLNEWFKNMEKSGACK